MLFVGVLVLTFAVGEASVIYDVSLLILLYMESFCKEIVLTGSRYSREVNE